MIGVMVIGVVVIGGLVVVGKVVGMEVLCCGKYFETKASVEGWR